MNVYIAESDVPNSYLGLSSTLFNKRVEHAPRTAAIWLFLLLRADVDAPPEWSGNFYSIIKDVFNDAALN